MEKLGLVDDSLKVKKVADSTGYIQNLVKTHIAQVTMEERTAEATCNREVAVR